MKHQYKTSGVCSRSISFDLHNDGTVTDITFEGGCHGNTQGVSALAEGMKATDVIERCKGINCGIKGTSCPDQLSRALQKALMLSVCLMLIFTLGSCSSNSRKIDAMIDQINSPAFRAEQAKTGLFDDTKAELEGQQLVITFLCRPFINLAGVNSDELALLEASAQDEFKKRAAIDDEFREGLEALASENYNLLLVWQDANGMQIKIPITPSKVL